MSATSAQGKPCTTETESTPSLPSSAAHLSTKPRIGSRVVWKTPTMRQSNQPMTGLVLLSTASAMRRKRSSARSGTSICGYSLNSTIAVTVLELLPADIAVEIELGTDRNIGSDDAPHMGQ